jgi:hypothetical protein
MMLARKLPYFNTKTLTLNLANLELGEGFRDFPFILFQNSFYFYIYFFNFFDFVTCNDGKQKYAMEKELIKIWWMKGREIKNKYAIGGRMTENKI